MLHLTHAKDYAWENIYVRIKTFFPDDSMKTDILSLDLADGGVWVGSCRREKCRLTIPLQQYIRFPLPGEYALTFEQYMRQGVVPGILGLGLTVVEAKGVKDQ
jgi:gliding motility-associated lipoprotein GldH